MGISNVGICECYNASDDHRCYQDQLTFRTGFSAVVVFVTLLVLCVSGCARHAAQSCPFGKFLLLLLVSAILLFVPNNFFEVFGNIAGVASAFYLIAQTILLMDFAYCWNEAWHTKAVESQRNLKPEAHRMWLAAIIVAAALMFTVAIVECILLNITFTTAVARALIIASFLLGLISLAVSITEWCEQ